MFAGLKNFSPSPRFRLHAKMKQANTTRNLPQIFDVAQPSTSADPSPDMTKHDIKVYVRCSSDATNVKQQCARILLPDQKSLAVTKQLSADTSSLELYTVQHVFDNDTCDNVEVFDKMCQPYLQRIIELESSTNSNNSNNSNNDDTLHPIFVTFGRTNSGKTHSIIGNVDEMNSKPLNGILIQFVSKLFAYFESANKPCNLKICALEEYGESASTLKLYDLFAKLHDNQYNAHEQVIGSPPSKSNNLQPTFATIRNVGHLETLLADACESVHCGLFENKIVSCGHCLFQLKINEKYFLSFFDMAGYHPHYKINNNVVPSNLTLNEFLKMLSYCCHGIEQQNIYVPTQKAGLIPNLQHILMQNNDIVFLLHISDHQQHLQHTLKTLEIAKMFPTEYPSEIAKQQNHKKQVVELDSYSLPPDQLDDDDEEEEETNYAATEYSVPEMEHEQEQEQERADLVFSPAPKIRLRKTHRISSNVWLQNVKYHIDTTPIVSRKQISSMPLEILQLKKSKSNAHKTFLVPLGFSSYDAFMVRRQQMDENSLEIHLRTNKSKFYIMIENLLRFRDWISSEIVPNTEMKEALETNSETESEEAIDIDKEFEEMDDKEKECDLNAELDELPELNYDYSCRVRPFLVLSVLLNILSFVILASTDFLEVQMSFFEPMQEMISRLSKDFESVQERYHQHQWESHEIISLNYQLDTISTYCRSYIAKAESEETKTSGLLEFCESMLRGHQTCPIDLLSI